MPIIIASHPNALTTAWAQAVINKQGLGYQVKKIAITGVDVGTTTRVRVAVNHNAPEHIPRQWFVKLPSLNWRARLITALPQLLHKEVLFYKHIAATVPLALPSVLAAQSHFIKGSTLVLADIEESGGIPGHSGDVLNLPQAALVVEQLARFHAQFWGKLDDRSGYRWLAGSGLKAEQHLGSILAEPLMKRGLQRAGQLIAKPLQKLAIRYAQQRNRVMAFMGQGTQTLVHHDCHPGNLFWQQNQPGFLDWQLVRSGEGISDIAYFLATAVSPETRRLHERQLLESYRHVLQQHGVVVEFEHLWQRYRLHLAYPFEAMVMTLSIGGMMDLPSNLELIRRAAAAVEDAESFSAIVDAAFAR